MAATMVLRRFAPMGITIITRMRVRLTATTGQIGSLAVCSLARDPGSTGFTAVAVFGVADGTAEASDAASTGADVDSRAEVVLIADADSRAEAVLIADADSRAEAGLLVAGPLRTDRLAVDPAVIAVVSTEAVAASTVEAAVASTVAAAVASTVAAEAMAAVTGN
jgi:hypothetical protein